MILPFQMIRILQYFPVLEAMTVLYSVNILSSNPQGPKKRSPMSERCHLTANLRCHANRANLSSENSSRVADVMDKK